MKKSKRPKKSRQQLKKAQPWPGRMAGIISLQKGLPAQSDFRYCQGESVRGCPDHIHGSAGIMRTPPVKKKNTLQLGFEYIQGL